MPIHIVIYIVHVTKKKKTLQPIQKKLWQLAITIPYNQEYVYDVAAYLKRVFLQFFSSFKLMPHHRRIRAPRCMVKFAGSLGLADYGFN